MNALLSYLGYSPTDKVVVINADDVGLCQSSLTAFSELLEAGLVSTGSSMVPCSWFPAVAALCRAHPEVEMGVHITLTCEWDAYRWGPISTRETASGLMDEEGYFPRSSRHVWEKANADAALKEVDAQLAKALESGVDVTHVDDHMAAWIHPRLFPSYVDLAIRWRLPMRFKRPAQPQPTDDDWQRVNYQEFLRAEANGSPLFDFSAGLPLENPHGQEAQARAIFDALPPGGLSLIVLHPAKDTPELRAIAHDWPSRVTQYEVFTCPELRAYARNRGIHIIGFKPIREYMRSFYNFVNY